MRKRDTQRSRVYAFERAVPELFQNRGTMNLQEAEEYAKRIWRKERGRYGLARSGPMEVEAGRGGGQAYAQRIKLGVWARQPAVILHELAHCLDRSRFDDRAAHGPRFVGIMIGLYCRHLGMDRDELLAAAYDHGVKVNLTAIGNTPEFGWHRRVERVLQKMDGRAANEVELAMALGVGYRVIRGAVLRLCQLGCARRRGRAILLVKEAT